MKPVVTAACALLLALWYAALPSCAVPVPMTLTSITENPTIAVSPAVRAQFDFPLRDPEAISNTFGPRWKISKERDDYHPGIDFFDEEGTPIKAIGDGVVARIYPDGDPASPNSGNTVAILHTLADPVEFHGVNISSLYTFYMHLKNFTPPNIAKGDIIQQGDVVGHMGQTGDTEFVHMHFETRLGTLCSLPYQLANPLKSCSVLQREPKVHPLLFLPEIPNGKGSQPVTKDIANVSVDAAASTITYLVPDRASLALNRILFGNVELDFSLYTGFDPSSLDVLDNFTYAWGRLVPGVFSSDATTVNMTLELDDASLLSGPITFVDVWGNGVRAELPGTPEPATGNPPVETTTTAVPVETTTTAVPVETTTTAVPVETTTTPVPVETTTTADPVESTTTAVPVETTTTAVPVETTTAATPLPPAPPTRRVPPVPTLATFSPRTSAPNPITIRPTLGTSAVRMEALQATAPELRSGAGTVHPLLLLTTLMVTLMLLGFP